MLFDPSTYNADSLYVIYSENFYKCPIKNNENTKQAIIESRKDWRTDGTVNLDNFDNFFIESLHSNQLYRNMTEKYCSQFPEEAVLGVDYPFPPSLEEAEHRHKGIVTNGIYRRDNDECIGWSIGKNVYKTQEVLFNAIKPEYRNQGIHTEIEMASLKFIFEGLNFDNVKIRIPLEESNEEKITWVGMSEYYFQEKHETLDRGTPVRYSRAIISKDSFLVWMSSNEIFKNGHFQYEHIYL